MFNAVSVVMLKVIERIEHSWTLLLISSRWVKQEKSQYSNNIWLLKKRETMLIGVLFIAAVWTFYKKTV